MSVGDNIREARIKKGLNQKELAEMLTQKGINVGNTTISNWENGTSKPDPDTIEEICKLLDVDGNFILGFAKKQDDNNAFDELNVLFSKHKDILTDDDKEYIKFKIEKRKKEIDRQLGEGNDI